MNAGYTCISGFRFTHISINRGIGTDMWQYALCSASAASEASLSNNPCEFPKLFLEFCSLLQTWRRRISEAQVRVKRTQILLSWKDYMSTWLPFACLKSSRITLGPWTFNTGLKKYTDFSESGHCLLFLAFKTTKQNRKIGVPSLASLWPLFSPVFSCSYFKIIQ